jgi:hypothetical protein
MSTSTTETNWDDPTRCPFCSESLVDGGAGFMAHIDDHPSCESGFEQWRGLVRQDMAGGWSG